MSFDLSVSVSNAVTREAVNLALASLGAPLRVDDNPADATGYFWVLYSDTGIEAVDGEFAGGFELHPPGAEEDAEDGPSYALILHDGDDETVAWVFALALARAGNGQVSDPQEGKTYRTDALEKRWKNRILKFRDRVVQRWNRLPAAERAFRTRREGETKAQYTERLFVRAAPPAEKEKYLNERVAAALAANQAEEARRLLVLFPAMPNFLTPGLQACFHANRPDLGREYASRFEAAHVVAHFQDAAGRIGFFAVKYVAFLLEIAGASLPSSVLAACAPGAGNDDIRRLLEGRLQ